ncbi:peptide chain release factor N(5)-glutamine methyltransferase [Patescibacteria group bacterium]|nr:peptide chain release factor N(5)-glutamine methyltransferase [Patescibacteria group bacterium]
MTLEEVVRQQPDEVRWLLEEKYHLSRAQALQTLQQLQVGDREAFRLLPELSSDFDQLAQRVPVAYLIGFVEFLGCHIDLSHRPLIPRPETEYWVEQFIEQEKKEERKLRVLDLCCGSGCIGVAVLSHLPNSSVTFVDINDSALQQVELNLQKNELDPKRWQVINSDLFSGINEKFDVILTNPPYVSEFGQFSPSVLHEPKNAIFAQNNGFKLIEKIILGADKVLKTEGQLWLEFAFDQAQRVQEQAKKCEWQVRVFSDQFGQDRYAILQK